MYFRVYQDTSKQWRWQLRAANHEIIAHGESYTDKTNCLKAVALVKSSSAAPIKEE